MRILTAPPLLGRLCVAALLMLGMVVLGWQLVAPEVSGASVVGLAAALLCMLGLMGRSAAQHIDARSARGRDPLADLDWLAGPSELPRLPSRKR